MFGHVRGAFSGAVADRRGYVSEAEGGTLFLDEVTDLSPEGAGEAAALRAGPRVPPRRRSAPAPRERAPGDGGERAARRVRAAGARSARTSCTASARRRSCCRRCASAATTSPGWRATSCAAAASDPPVAPAVWGLLARHHWPGNVRELESEMARALARAAGGTVRPEHLSVALQRVPRAPLRPLRQALADVRARAHRARPASRTAGTGRAPLRSSACRGRRCWRRSTAWASLPA